MEKSRAKYRVGRSFLFCSLLICIASSCVFAQQPPRSTPLGLSGENQTPATGVPLLDFHEDWTSLTLKGSDLRALNPILGEKDDVPGATFIRERYQMAWRPGDPLDVFVIRPKGVVKPPVILYLYSFPQDTDRFKNDRFCETVTANGFAAVGFVSHLTGQRIHDRPATEWFISELQESLADSTHDVQMILNYVATRSDLDSSRIGMFGVGSGGAIAILAAAADPRIKVINLLSPWGDWPDWLAKSSIVPNEERAAYLTPDFLAKLEPLDPAAWLPKLTTTRVRIQDVRGTSILPDECQKKIEGAAPPEAIVDQFENGRAFVPVSAGGKVFDWLKDELGTVPLVTIPDNSPGIHFYPSKSESAVPQIPAIVAR